MSAKKSSNNTLNDFISEDDLPFQKDRGREPKVTIGYDLHCVPDLEDAVVTYVDHLKFEFLALPLVHPRFVRDVHNAPGGFTRSDLILPSDDWSSVILGKISSWLELDSSSDKVRRRSEEAFMQEMRWAAHLSLSAVLLPTPSAEASNLARFVRKTLASVTNLRVYVEFPLMPPEVEVDFLLQHKHTDYAGTLLDPWERWNAMRTLCKHHSSLQPVLLMTANMPSDEELDRWAGEPVAAIIVPTKIFVHNKAGHPVLTMAHRQFVLRMFKYNVEIILRGAASMHMAKFREYLHYLIRANGERWESDKDRYEHPYFDYLQAPLQPLQDHLESQTYETFERDPIKYQQYQEAIYRALCDTAEDKVTVLMVVGAGRGPLVRASLVAATRAKRQLRVYAVEKNPNAVVTLENLRISQGWQDIVTIVSHDMRTWDAPEKADILVSELLGSWGDNEASPECLDGAQHFLKEDGISIPCKYTSYVAPICSSKLFNEMRAMNDTKLCETPFVVKIHNAHEVDSPQACFVFHHPNREVPIDNTRYTKLTFTATHSTTIHGFSGYFDAQLYKDVYVSILPETHSPGMFSWFPLYLPIRNPLYVAKGSTIEAHFWRCVDSRRLWYEWAIVKPYPSIIHNASGESYFIGL